MSAARLFVFGRLPARHRPLATVTVDAIEWATTLSALRTCRTVIAELERENDALRADTEHPLDVVQPVVTQRYRDALAITQREQREYIARLDARRNA